MKMRRILALFLSLVMIFSLAFPGGVAFAETPEEATYLYTVDPTCTEQGYDVYEFDGEEYYDNYSDALGHAFEDGACTVCGEADPDYDAPVLMARGFGGGGIVTAPRPQPAANIAYVSIEDDYAGTYYVGDMETFDYLNAALRAAGTSYSDDVGGPYGVLDTTVTMLRGFTLDEAFDLGQSITLDLAGNTLTLGSNFSFESGELIITGTGKLNGYDAEDPQVSFDNGYVYYNGSVVLGSTVTFDYADGSPVTTQPVANGQKAIKPENPTRDGYDFDGWFDGTHEWDFDDRISSDVTLTAHWTAKEYSITYDLVGGALPEGQSNPVTYTVESDSFTLVNPTRADKYFTGWTEQIGEAAATDASASVTVAQGSTGNRIYTATWGDAVAKVNGVGYGTLQDALNAASDDDTVTLLGDLTLSAVADLSENKTLTLDFGGHTLSSSVADADAGTRVLTVEAGALTVQNGTINGRVNAYDNGTLTIAATATVNGTVIVWGDGEGASAKTPSLNVYGKISTTDYYAISTNGTDKSGANINIFDGAVITQTGDTAIYLPSGNLTVNGGSITGATGIFVRGGNLSIPATYEGQPNAAVITGTGEDLEPAFAESGDGSNSTGEAVTIVNSDYPNAIAVTIAGGTFNSTNANAVGSYAKNDSLQAPTGFVSGGVFNTPVADAYCADNFMPSEDNGNYGVQPCYVVTFKLNGGTIGDSEDDVKIKVPATDSETVTAPAAPVKAASGAVTYAFTGWKNGDDVVAAGGLTTAITSNATYEAQYEATDNVAKIGDVLYPTLAAAFAAAQSGDVVNVVAGEVNLLPTDVIPEGVTVQGQGKEETTLKLTSTYNITNANVTIKDVFIDGSGIGAPTNYGGVINFKADNGKIEGCKVYGGGGTTWSATVGVGLAAGQTAYITDTYISGGFRGVFLGSQSGGVVIDGCTIVPGAYPINVDGGNAASQFVEVKNSTLKGWTSYSSLKEATFENVVFEKGNYDYVRPYSDTTFKNCTFDNDFGMNVVAGSISTLEECYKTNANGESELVTTANYSEFVSLDSGSDAIAPVAKVGGTLFYSSVTTPDMTEAVTEAKAANYEGYTFYADPTAALQTVDRDAHLVGVANGDTAGTWRVVKGVATIELDQTTASVDEGGTLTLTATVGPDDANNKSIVWSSSDETVATVADGVVTAANTLPEGVGGATVTITATAADGSGVSATCTVTVKNPNVKARSKTESGDWAYYESFEKALAAIYKDGGTVELLADDSYDNWYTNVNKWHDGTTGGSGVGQSSENNGTVNIIGNGHTLTFSNVTNGNGKMVFWKPQELNVSDLTLNLGSGVIFAYMKAGSFSNVNFTGGRYALSLEYTESAVAMDECSFSGMGTAFYAEGPSAAKPGMKAAITNSTFTNTKVDLYGEVDAFSGNTVTGGRVVFANGVDVYNFKGNDLSSVGYVWSLAGDGNSVDLNNNYWGDSTDAVQVYVSSGEVVLDKYYTSNPVGASTPPETAPVVAIHSTVDQDGDTLNTYYPSLAAAAAAVQADGDTITLIANDESTIAVAVDYSLTLDVVTFNVAGQITVASGKTLVIEGSGEFTNTPSGLTVGQSLKGGTYPTDVNAYCAADYYAQKSGDKYVVTNGTAVAKIGDAYYTSLSAALTAANAVDESVENVTITILKDIDELMIVYEVNPHVTFTATTPVTVKIHDTALGAHRFYFYKGATFEQNVTWDANGTTSAPSGFVTEFRGNTQINGTTKFRIFRLVGEDVVGTVSETGRLICDVEVLICVYDGATLIVNGTGASMEQEQIHGTIKIDNDSTEHRTNTVTLNSTYAKLTGITVKPQSGTDNTVEDTFIFNVNNSRVDVVQSNVSFGDSDETVVTLNESTMTLSDGLSFTLGAGQTLNLDEVSSITVGTWTNNGTVNVDVTDLAAAALPHTIVDVTGSTAPTPGTINLTNNDKHYAVTVVGKEIVIDSSVARIGEGENAKYFATLADAIAAVPASGGTVTLLKDVTVTAPLPMSKSYTLDFDSHTVFYNATNTANVSNSATIILKNGKLDISDCRINSSTDQGMLIFKFNPDENTLTFDKMELYGKNCRTYGIFAFANSTNGSTVNFINGSKLVLENETNLDYSDIFKGLGGTYPYVVNFTDSTVSCTNVTRFSLYGTVNVTNSTVTFTGGENAFRQGAFTFDNSTVTVSGAKAEEGKAISPRFADTKIKNGSTLRFTGSNIGKDVCFEYAANIEVDHKSTLTVGSVSGSAADRKIIAPEGYDLLTTVNADGTTTYTAGHAVARIGDVNYATLAEAFKAAVDGDTIVLLAAHTLPAKLSVAKSVTLDLNSKSLTGRISATAGGFTLEGGTLKGRLDAYDASTVTIASGATVDGAVVVWGDGTYGQSGCLTPTLNVNGRVVRSADAFTGVVGLVGDESTYALVTTNGTDASKPVINIGEGAVIDGGSEQIGVYLPSGALSVSGGTITGSTAVYFKSTDLTITGGELHGKGAKTAYNYNGNGGNATGDALVIDSCNYPNGVGTVSVSGGTFISDNAEPIGSYNSQGGALQTKFVSKTDTTAPMFNKELPLAYCADGFMPEGTPDPDTGLYTITTGTAVASITTGTSIAYFPSIQAAITAAQPGDTIVLLKDIELSGTEQVVINKVGTYVIDGDGHSITPASDSAYTYHRFMFGDSGQAYDSTKDFTLKNVTISGFTNSTYFIRNEGCSVKLDNVTLTGNDLSGQANSRLILNTHAAFTMTGCTVTNNKSADSLVDFNSNASGNGTNPLSVEDCLFQGNTNGGVAVIQIAEDSSAKVEKSTFKGNTVNAVNNGAVVYFGDTGGDCTGSLFKDNIINYTTTSGYENRVRVAGAIFTWAIGDDPGTISGNAFVNNQVVKQNENYLTCYASAIYSGGYYNAQDLAGNYFGGSAPVVGQADKSSSGNDIYAEYSSKPVYASSYCNTYTENPNDHGVSVSGEVEMVARIGCNTYPTLAEALAAAVSGNTVELLDNATLSDSYDLTTKITLELNGKTITPAIGSTTGSGKFTANNDHDYLIGVKRGASLKVQDSSNPSTGSINAGDLWVAIKATIKGEAEVSEDYPTINVNGGSITGYYYAISGNGTRQGTLIQVSGGTLTGTNGTAIYQPQAGMLMITGGKFVGLETGIEVRSGQLQVTGGTFETKSTNYSCNPNTSGTTTVGAAIAIAQHTTNNPIKAKIEGATFVVPTGGTAVEISIKNPQNNTFDNVEVQSSVINSAQIPDGYFWKENTTTGLYELTKAVATIGETPYASLAEAFAAVTDSTATTIEVLANSTGAGIVVPSGRNITVNFNNHSYTVVEGPGAGSAGTENQVFQLLKDSTIVFNDGVIAVGEENATLNTYYRVIQNYSNLTLNNMEVKGDNLKTYAGFTNSVIESDNGTVALTGTTKILDVTVGSETIKAVNVDAWNGAYPDGTQLTVNLAEGGEIGTIHCFTEGTGTAAPSTLYIAAGAVGALTVAEGNTVAVSKATTAKVAAPAGYMWKYDATLGRDVLQTVVATITIGSLVTNYASLADAFAAVTDGTATTIEVMADSTGSGIIVPSGRNITVNFNNHSYTVVEGPGAGSAGTENQVFQLLKDSTIVFNDGVIAVGEENATLNTYYRVIQNYSNLTLNNMEVKGDNLKTYAGFTNSVIESDNGTVALTGTTKILDVAAGSETIKAVNVDAWNGAYPDGTQLTVNLDEGGQIGTIHCFTEGTGTAAPSTLYIAAGTVGALTVAEGNTVAVSKATTAQVAAPAGYKWSEAVSGVQTLIKDSFLVTVTSSGNGTISGSPMAPVSGGGEFEFGTEIIVKASEVGGYTFVGWYDAANPGEKLPIYVDGDGVTHPLWATYTVQATETYDKLVAVYNASSTSTFKLLITGSKFKVSGFSATQQSRMNANIPANTVVEVTFADSTQDFLYWINGANKVVSTNGKYKFTITMDTTLTAVYNAENSPDAQALVVFTTAGKYPQVISSCYYGYGDSIAFPTAPPSMGQTFQYWTINGTDPVTQEDIWNEMESSSRIVVYPVYTNTASSYTLTAYYWSKRDGALIPVTAPDTNPVTREANIGIATTLVAPEFDNHTFAYWSYFKVVTDGDQVSCEILGDPLSYTSEYFVRPTADVVVAAVYDDSKQAEPTIYMSDKYGAIVGDKYVVSFTTNYDVPTGYEILNAGFVYINTTKMDDPVNDLKIGGEGVKNAPSVLTTSTGVITLDLPFGKKTTEYYARGYLTVKNTETEEVLPRIYTTVDRGSYETVRHVGED